MVSATSNSMFFIGASDAAVEGNWQWSNGQPMTGPWGSWMNQPNGRHGENCALFHTPSETFYDDPCSSQNRVLCS